MDKKTTVAIGVAAAVATAGVAYALVQSQSGGGGGATSFILQVVDFNTNLPISGASVTYNAQTKVTGSNGTVAFAAASGFTPLDVTAPGYQELLEPNFQGVNGQSYTAAMLSLTSANIVVKVLDTNNQPVQGATVALGTASGMTDATGSVGFSGLVPGTYLVTASKTGYTSTSQQILVNAGGGTFTLYLSPVGGALSATIVSPAVGSSFPVGSTIAFQGSAAGGTAPYTFRWFFPDGSVVPGQTAMWIAPSKGDYIVTLNVEDAARSFANALVPFTVV